MATRNYHRETSVFERQARVAPSSVGFQLTVALATVGSLIATVALISPDAYLHLLREDGPIEYGSSLFWVLAVVTGWLGLQDQKELPKSRRAAAALVTLFCGVCGGEEISWGQRIFGFAGPRSLISINHQHETNLHNIGSISVFSNLFFLLTLLFFVGLPYLQNRRVTPGHSAWLERLKSVLPSVLPQVPQGARNVFLVSLGLWVFVGLRFGTLGFHPYSLWGYYTQMDDEIFEFCAAYSFWTWSLLDRQRYKSQHPLADIVSKSGF